MEADKVIFSCSKKVKKNKLWYELCLVYWKKLFYAAWESTM